MKLRKISTARKIKYKRRVRINLSIGKKKKKKKKIIIPYLLLRNLEGLEVVADDAQLLLQFDDFPAKKRRRR